MRAVMLEPRGEQLALADELAEREPAIPAITIQSSAAIGSSRRIAVAVRAGDGTA